MVTTPQQLIERWETPEGRKIRIKIIRNIKSSNWHKFLEGFPFSEEIKVGIDLRFIKALIIPLN